MTKIKKSLVEQIIKEEVIKIKKFKALQEEKKVILKQLNELYEEETLEEGNITPENVDAELQKAFAAKMKKFPGQKAPNWMTVGTPAYEKAKVAALELGTADIYYNPTYGKYMATQYSSKPHTFGGGAGM